MLSQTSSIHSALVFSVVTGQGFYIYIEASWPRRRNDTAKLISAQVPATTGSNGKCLSFWYHMYGADINTLGVYVRTGSHDTLLWSKRGTRGDKWIKALVTVTSRSPFKVCVLTSYFLKVLSDFFSLHYFTRQKSNSLKCQDCENIKEIYVIYQVGGLYRKIPVPKV